MNSLSLQTCLQQAGLSAGRQAHPASPPRGGEGYRVYGWELARKRFGIYIKVWHGVKKKVEKFFSRFEDR